MFSRIFIERPKLAMVISIVMVFAGYLCMQFIPVAEYPEVPPTPPGHHRAPSYAPCVIAASH